MRGSVVGGHCSHMCGRCVLDSNQDRRPSQLKTGPGSRIHVVFANARGRQLSTHSVRVASGPHRLRCLRLCKTQHTRELQVQRHGVAAVLRWSEHTALLGPARHRGHSMAQRGERVPHPAPTSNPANSTQRCVTGRTASQQGHVGLLPKGTRIFVSGRRTAMGGDRDSRERPGAIGCRDTTHRARCRQPWHP